MPNTFAYFALFSWVLVVLALFRVLAAPKALAWSIISGYLLLPTRAELNLPMVPPLDRDSIPCLAAALMCVVYRKRWQPTLPPGTSRRAAQTTQSRRRSSRANDTSSIKRGMGETVLLLLVVVLVVVPFLTVWQNRQPVIAGPTFISGLRLYDAFSMSARTLIMIVPFLLAQRFLASADSHRMLLKALVIAAVAYSFLVLFEVRMSPQLNAWIYGFFPHSWTQHLRGGGFRPVVFLPHGLALGLFLASAVVAAAVLWRDALKTRALAMPWHYATVWLALALLLSRNFGAMALAILMASLVLLAPPRWGVWAAGGIAIIVLAYPALRTAGWVPTDIVQGIVSSMDEQRAGSLQFRIENEDILLARANAKPVAGWGSWGRGRVYDEVTGRDVSVTDGLWVIRIGASGWLGYLSMFGLLTLPGVLIWSRLGPEKIDGATVGLMLIMALALLDAIPNAFLGPVHWLIAGALAGRYVQIARELELPSSSGGCS